MPKFLKIILKILLGLIALLTIAAFVILDEVDYTPYFNTNYYENTRERLDSLGFQTQLHTGEVSLGFGRVNMTPQIGSSGQAGVFSEIPLAGYGDREGAPATGVHDSLYVSAVAVGAGEELRILLSADMLIIPPNISESVSQQVFEKTGITKGQIFFAATHTHGSVGAWSDRYIGELFGGKLNPALIEWLSSRFVQAIEVAIQDLKPGAVAIGSFNAPELVRNRLVGDKGVEDGEFLFMRMVQNEGKTAILGSFDAHATTLNGDNMEFSADYPGYWRAALEQKGIDYAIFFAGSVGSHAPVSVGEQFEEAGYLGKTLADSVWKYVMDVPLEDTLQLASVSVEIDMPGFQVRVSDGLSLAPYFSKQLFPALGKVRVQAMRLGKLIWGTAPADFSGEMAIDLKNAMYRKGFLTQVTSFNGAYVGYIIPAKYYHLDEYESRVMSWFGPGMGPYVDEMIRRSMECVSGLK